ERHVLGVAADETVPGVPPARLRDLSVLGEVIEADDVVAVGEQLLHEVAADEPGGARDEHLHGRRFRRNPKTSTTGLSIARSRYSSWHAPRNTISASRSAVSSGTKVGSWT